MTPNTAQFGYLFSALGARSTHPQPPLPPDLSDPPHISEVYRWLMESDQRNRRIVDDIAANIEAERHPLVLTERRQHAERLADMLTERGFRAVVLRGAMRAGESRAANEQLPKAEVIVATGKYTVHG